MKDKELVTEIRTALLEISAFVRTPAFHQVLTTLWSLPAEEQPRFVRDVIIDKDELQRRGVVVPSDLTVQRSAFRDGRPTLFCVLKHLPPGLLWEKVTITFDRPDGRPAVNYHELAAAPEAR